MRDRDAHSGLARCVVGVVTVLLLAANCQAGSPGVAAQAPAVSLEPVASGLSQPIFVTGAPDGSGRLFVVERGGQIKIVTGQGVLATPFLNISSLIVSSGSEQGLLGLAFDPSFRTNRRFYVFYTAASPSGQLTVARYTASLSNPNVANTNGTILLAVPHAQFQNHNGGMLAFGPDGMLYVSTGDGGSGGDPDGNAQNLNTLLGKLLRLDVRGAGVVIPPSNPFAGQSGRRGEIWASGLRNPWRFSFDRLTGEVYIGDVGQGTWEEVDYQPAGSPGGLNYGWDIREGAHCFGASTCNTSGLTDPILEYNRSGFSPCGSITGGYVSRGRWAPALYGEYLYADYCTGQIWRAEQTGGVWGSNELTDRAHQISSFGESERGELHVVNYSSGQILRLEQRCPEGQYRADYFPTANQGVDPQLSRCETGLNQDWGSGSPDPGLPSNGFSARWLGHHTFTAGSYRFIGQAEGGLRVYLDGQLLIDGWSVPSGTEVRAARVLTAGSHSIEVEYEERGGDASIELRWEPAGTANLSLSVSAAPDPVAVGSRLTYSLSVSNAGPQPADIQVVDTLPERVTYESSSVSQGAGCSLAGSTVTCLLGTLNQNGSATATIVVIPRPLSSGTTATLVNQATALSTDAGDPNLANNSVTTESDVKGLTRRPSPRGGNGSLSAEAESESEPEEADATPTRIPSPTPTATVATPSATPTATPRIAPSRPARR